MYLSLSLRYQWEVSNSKTTDAVFKFSVAWRGGLQSSLHQI